MNQYLTKLDRLFAASKLLEAAYPLSPNIMFWLVDQWDKFENERQAIEALVNKFDVSWQDAEEHIKMAEEEFGELVAVEEGLGKSLAAAGLATTLALGPMAQAAEPVKTTQLAQAVQEIDPAEIDMEVVKQIESSGNPEAINKSSGARGLYQITPITLKEWNRLHPKERYSLTDLFNPEICTKIANWYMKFRIPQMLNTWGKPLTLKNLIQAWNQGPNHVKLGSPLPKDTVDFINKYLAKAR